MSQPSTLVIPVKSTESVSLDAMSKFGRFQCWQYALAMLPVLFTAMSNINYVFAAAADDARYVKMKENLDNRIPDRFLAGGSS